MADVGGRRAVRDRDPDRRRDEHRLPGRLGPAGVRCESGWRCLRVAGTLDFGMVGVLAGLVGPLAAVGVRMFVVSTFDTDYLFVRDNDLERTVEALERTGYNVDH